MVNDGQSVVVTGVFARHWPPSSTGSDREENFDVFGNIVVRSTLIVSGTGDPSTPLICDVADPEVA